jgi:hypothetical protein
MRVMFLLELQEEIKELHHLAGFHMLQESRKLLEVLKIHEVLDLRKLFNKNSVKRKIKDKLLVLADRALVMVLSGR